MIAVELLCFKLCVSWFSFFISGKSRHTTDVLARFSQRRRRPHQTSQLPWLQRPPFADRAGGIRLRRDQPVHGSTGWTETHVGLENYLHFTHKKACMIDDLLG